MKSVWTKSRFSSSSSGPKPETRVSGGLEYPLVLGEELLGDRLDVEGRFKRRADAARLLAFPVDVGDLLHGGAARQVALDHHAPQHGLRVLEGGVDEVHLAAPGVGEDQQQVIAKLVRDQLGCRGRLGLAHPVGLCDIEGHVADVDAVELCNAFGGVRQRDAGGGTGQAHLAGGSVKVQHLDEQRADGGSAPVG